MKNNIKPFFLKAWTSFRRFPIACLLLAVGCAGLIYISFSLIFQAYLPSDGVLWTELSPLGISAANQLLLSPDVLQVGDQLLAVDGHDLWAWVDNALNAGPGANWRVGQTVLYRLRRDGKIVDLPIKLVPFPMARLPVYRLGVYALFFLSIAVSGYLLFARPDDAAAQLLFLTTLGLIFPLTLHVQTMTLVKPLFFIIENVVKFFGRSLMASAFLHLSLIFPVVKPGLQGAKSYRRKWLRVLHVAIPLLSVSIGWLVAGAPAQKLALAWQVVSWMVLLMLVGGIVSIVHTYVTVREPTARSQIRWLAWGSVVGLLPYVALTALPEAISGRPLLTIEITAFFVVVVPISLAVAIVRYRLFDIDMLIRRSLFYTLFVLCLTALYLFIGNVLRTILAALFGQANNSLVVFIATLVVSTLFWVLQSRAARLITRMLYPDYVDEAVLLKEMSEKLNSAIRFEDVETLLTQILPRRVGAQYGSVLVLGDDPVRLNTKEGRTRLLAWDQLWTSWRVQGAGPITCSMPPSWLSVDVLHEIVGPRAALALPLVAGEQMLGLWVLGARASSLPYTTTETHALNILAHQAAIAMQNARLVRQLEMQSQWLVNEVRRRTKDLEDERNRLTIILQNMADGLLVTDVNGRLVLFNHALESMIRCSSPLVADMPLKLAIDSAVLFDLVEKAMGAPGQVVNDNFELHARVFYASATALHDRSGVITVLRDITHETEVDRIKSEFISTASHELRTPLTSILGFARLIQRAFERSILPALPTDAQTQRSASRVADNLGIIAAEGERLTRLINDMLDLAKMDDGKME